MKKIIVLAGIFAMISCKKEQTKTTTNNNTNSNVTPWTSISPTGVLPSGRGECSSVIDNNGNFIIFGGIGNNGIMNDLWRYDTGANTWTQLNPGGTSPSARNLHTAVWDNIDNVMIIYGGNNISSLGDIWSYSPSGNVWKQLTPTGTLPSARQGHSAVWDYADSAMVIFGGTANGTNLNDMWAYSPSHNSWVKINPGGTIPSPCFGQAAVWAVNGNGHPDEMILFGGSGTAANTANANMYSYFPSTNTCYFDVDSGAPWPGARELQAISWVYNTRTIFIFGGTTNGSSSGSLNDLWMWSDSWGSQGFGWGWYPINTSNTPSARYGMASQYSEEGRMFIFGGIGKSGYLNDLWEIIDP